MTIDELCRKAATNWYEPIDTDSEFHKRNCLAREIKSVIAPEFEALTAEIERLNEWYKHRVVCSECFGWFELSEVEESVCKKCRRIAELERENSELRLQLADNPEHDCTDAAHPAWWRGHDHAVSSLCERINAILSGDNGQGVCKEPWESVRRRLLELRRDAERLMDSVFSGYAIIHNHSLSSRLSPREQSDWKRWSNEIIEESGKTRDELQDAYVRRHPDDAAIDAALKETTK